MAPTAPATIAIVLLAAVLAMPLAVAQPGGAPIAGPAATASSPLPKGLAFRRDEPVAAVGSGLAIAVVLLALGAGIIVLRRSQRRGARGWHWCIPRSEHAVARIASLPLTPHASLHAVRWNGEELLLACTAQQVTVVGRRSLPPGTGEGA